MSPDSSFTAAIMLMHINTIYVDVYQHDSTAMTAITVRDAPRQAQRSLLGDDATATPRRTVSRRLFPSECAGGIPSYSVPAGSVRPPAVEGVAEVDFRREAAAELRPAPGAEGCAGGTPPAEPWREPGREPGRVQEPDSGPWPEDGPLVEDLARA